MRLTVLGKSPSWQDAGGACSGYLIEEDGVAVVVDCGNGVFSKLRRFRDYTRVDAVVISHLHAEHFLETFAIRVESSLGGGAFAFGADSRPTDELVEFAHEADLLLIEATLPRPERTGERGHLTPREAGEHGRAAAAKRLVLTHISDELDAEWARKEARAVFDGPVEVAREGAVYSL